MDKKTTGYGLIIACTIAIILFGRNTVDSSEASTMAMTSNLPQQIYSVDLNKAYDWCGEILPSNYDVKERLDRELSVNAYWQSNTLLNIKMSNRFFPVIERVFAEQGVPDDFKYLAVAESNLRNVSSPANAKGYWQFRKLAAKEFGLEVNDEVDERYHIEKSTLAAAKYIKQLKKRFGTWTDAAAAYNIGPTRYKKIRTEQKEDNYYNLNLNSETSRYVFRLIAFKEIMSSPQDFGFYIQQEEKYPTFENTYEVKVDKSVASWPDFAKQYGISYRTLKFYNPWLIDTKLTVKKNTYFIKIPR